ncbi:MAG: DUF721 domain-containing protein [Bifidobacterium mongoliense]|nr:DUF721 domain-containing protein [Bifidobacterium mongoliense]
MTPPIVVTLHLDQRKLPAEVFQRLAARSGVFRDRKQREQDAWESFGKPGRDPDHLGSVLAAMALTGNWAPNLELAKLRNHWDQVVGGAIAMHSTVVGCDEGVLTIRAESTVWATQLTYLIPQLTHTIRERLSSLDIREIRVAGPGSQRFSGGRKPRNTNDSCYPGSQR